MAAASLPGGHHHHPHQFDQEHARQILQDLDRGLGHGFHFGSAAQLEAGSATVLGGTDALYGRREESIRAGSGHETMLGAGFQASTVFGSGFTAMVAHGQNDSWGGGGASNVFEFDHSISGGHHLIHNFTDGPDKLHLVGYDTTVALQHGPASGGSTVISLDGGKTEIVLNGVLHLGKHDLIK
jgi:hypothetical protein